METGVEKQVNGIIPSFPRRNKQRRKGEAWGWDGYRGVRPTLDKFLCTSLALAYNTPPHIDAPNLSW